MSEFDKWYEAEPMPQPERDILANAIRFLNKKLCENVWDYQQDKINKLEAELNQQRKIDE